MRALLSIVAIAALAAAAPDRSEPRCNSLETACSDLYLAIECGTVDQCIPRWEKLSAPVGNDTELCATCKKMVQEARDNLLSNMTQTELREVLEGSCDDLIPIRPFNTICKKLMDTFQDELNDMLVSRMDPTQVCTVSGLCWKPDNSDMEQRASNIFLRKSAARTCNTCRSSVSKIVGIAKFADKGDVVRGFSNACRNAGYTRPKCDEFAQTYVAKFLHHIQNAPSEKTCQFFGRCDGMSRPMTVGPADTMECEFCEAMIHKVVVQFNNTSMKEQVKTVLENICKTTGSWAAECQQRIADDFDRAYDELISMLDPVNVCSLAGLCNSKQSLRTLPLTRLTPARPPAPGSTAMCTICQEVAKVVQKAVNANFTQNQLVNALDLVCDVLPVVSKGNCFDFVNKNVPQLIKMFNERFTVEHICSESFKLCPAVSVVQQAAPAPGPMCDECLQIANKIVAAIKDDKTEQNIKNVLDQTCQSCPDQAGCKKFIDDNIDRLFEVLRQDVTADQICQALRLCSARRLAVHQKVVAKSEICDQCLQITNYIVDAIKDDKTEQNIKNVLEKTCQNCPDYAACKQFIDVNLDDLFELLRKDVTAAQICQALRLCAAQTVIPAKTFVKTEICDKCLDVANRIVDAIKDDKTEQNIKNVLDQTCQSCPDQAGCKKFIDDNIDQLFELLRQDVTADQICKALRLCSAQPAVHKKVVPKAGICDQCLSIANYIVSAIENDRTEQNIKNVLDTACAICPDQAGCKQVIDANIDQLYDLLRKDVTAAQICAALRLCGAEVMIPKEIVAKVENCGVCSMIVDYIIDKLKGNSTDEAIIDTLEKVCKVLPVDQKECQNYVDVYGGYIVSLIEKNYAADAICAAIGLCKTPKPVIRTPKTICNECQQIAGYLVSAVNDNRSEENIKAVVEKVCEMIPMDVGQCQQFIDTNIDQLYQLLRNEVTVDHICQTLRLCRARAFPVPLRPKTKVRSCGLCSEVVDYLIGAIKDNSTDAQILDALERVCNVLPFDKTECQNVINVYGEYIIVMIQQDVAADVICQKIGFCAPPPPPRSSLTSSSCDLCQMISGFVISELKDNTTDAAIIEVLERGCSVLPIDKAQCRNVVDVYGSMIVNMIQNNLTPDEICGTLRLCAAPRPKGQSCELCETVAHFLVDELKDNKTDAAILEVLERVCKVLPVDKVSCQNTIDVYGKMIMDLIQQDASADQICAAIGLCSTRRVVEKAKGDFCNACKMIAGFLVDELKDNKTDAAILAALEKVCKVVPVDSVQCKNYIDVYGNMVIEMIENNLSPDQICSSIGYCTARTELGLTDNQACPLCEIVVHVVEAELQNNNTQKEIETALEKACSLLPQNEAQQCRNMVNVYTTYIIDMVESLATAEQICQTLGFCPTPPTPPKCEVCLFITNFVESELSDNRTESQILKLLDKACDVIPNMDVPQCKETINQFSDMIITLLLQSVPPRKICEEIKMCPLSKKPDTVPVVRVPLADGEQCTFCKWLVTWVDDKLDDNRTEAVIIDELDKACDLLTDAGKCKDMVNDYVDMIVKMLIQYADPQKICEAIKKCPPKQYRKVEPPCRYCRYVIDELRGDVQKTEAELKKKLDGICRVIPVDTSSCQAFVEQYAEQIINLILSDTDPEKICEILGVCPKKIRATDSKCDFCREVMQFVVDEVKDETTDDEIVGLVARACNYVPATHREDCQRMVEIEGLVIVRMIGESLDADSICGALKYCPEKRSPDNLTCTWCQYALHFIQEKLYDNSTQQMIQEALEKMCLDLPKPELSAECREFVDAYGPSLEVIIAQDLDPSVICPAIRACPARKALSKPARRTSSQKCHDCVSTLRSFRHNPAQICKGVSSQFATKCVGASSVGVQLANAFESDYKICQYAKSCSKVSGSFRCNRGGCQHVR